MSLLIATVIAANVASCRDFNLGGGGGSSAGTSGAGAGGRDSFPIEAGNVGIGGQVATGMGGSNSEQHGGANATGDGDAGATANDAGAGGDREHIDSVSPAALSGLSLWLESSESAIEGTNSRVSKWKDSSGNHNDAVEANPARRPLFVSQTLNDWPTVKFDADPSNLTIPDRKTLQFGAEPFTVAFVAELGNSEAPEFTQTDNLLTFTYSGYGELLAKAAVSDPYDGIAVFANFPSAYSTSPAQRRLAAQLEFGTAVLVSTALNVNDGRFRLFVIQRSAPGMLEQRINGSPQGRLEINANIDVSAPGEGLHLGGHRGVPFRGSIAELAMVKGALTEANLLGLERYLMEKFGL